jgi:O-antigen ligase
LSPTSPPGWRGRGESADTVLAMNGRLGLWSDLMPTILGHLFLGYGYQASRSVLLDAASWAAYAHNAVLQTLLDLGLVGTLALVAIVVSGVRGATHRALPAPLAAAVAAMMVFLVVNSVSTESFAGAPGFEATVLLLCAVSGARRDTP